MRHKSAGSAGGIALWSGRKKSPHEQRLQMVMIDRFRRIVNPWDAQLVMVPNGGYRPSEALDKLFAMGLEPGWPDLMLIMDRGRVRWVEVKLYKTLHHDFTDLDELQVQVHDTLRFLGHTPEVWRSLDEMYDVIEAEEILHRPFTRTPPQDVLDLSSRPRGVRSARGH